VGSISALLTFARSQPDIKTFAQGLVVFSRINFFRFLFKQIPEKSPAAPAQTIITS
jgi:hypothetical protein